MGTYFLRWYNEKHRHSSIRFVTPADRHSGKDRDILANRSKLYVAAKEKHPARWSGKIRNWTLIDEVWLNPENQTVSKDEIVEEAA